MRKTQLGYFKKIDQSLNYYKFSNFEIIVVDDFSN